LSRVSVLGTWYGTKKHWSLHWRPNPVNTSRSSFVSPWYTTKTLRIDLDQHDEQRPRTNPVSNVSVTKRYGSHSLCLLSCTSSLTESTTNHPTSKHINMAPSSSSTTALPGASNASVAHGTRSPLFKDPVSRPTPTSKSQRWDDLPLATATEIPRHHHRRAQGDSSTTPRGLSATPLWHKCIMLTLSLA